MSEYKGNTCLNNVAWRAGIGTTGTGTVLPDVNLQMSTGLEFHLLRTPHIFF